MIQKMAVPQKNYEPITVVAGDTISFIRYLSNYLASAGWQLEYNLRGGAQAIQFLSTASGDSHSVIVAATVTETWLPGAYLMEGFAVNAGTGERERIYLNNLTITPDLSTAGGDEVVTTHAQRMIALIEGVQEEKFTHDILNSDVEGTRIMRLTPPQLREEYNYWIQIRSNEIKIANSKAGRSNGRNRFTVFTDPSGQAMGQFGALPPIFPFGGEQP